MRRTVKRALELSLTRSGIAAFARGIEKDRILILAYHNIVPSSDPPTGDSSLHLPLGEFQTQLQILQETFEIVSLGDLLKEEPEGGRRRAAITFDDGYRGTVELGLKELVRRDLPATVFVCPGLLGTGGFWWDRLAREETGVVPAVVRRYVLDQLHGEQQQALSWAESEGLPLQTLTQLYRPASQRELEEASGLPKISFASHSWSHLNLAATSGSRLQEEILRTCRWLEEFPSGEPHYLSYPYGSRNEAVARVVEEAGIGAALLVTGGLTRREELSLKPLAIPRMNVPRGLSAEGFLARISGVWPR